MMSFQKFIIVPPAGPISPESSVTPSSTLTVSVVVLPVDIPLFLACRVKVYACLATLSLGAMRNTPRSTLIQSGLLSIEIAGGGDAWALISDPSDPITR